MKNISVSKTVRIILVAGIFVVVLAGLGFTRYQQSVQLRSVQEDLTMSELRLKQFNNPVLQEKITELEAILAERERQTGDVVERLNESVISADVTELFYHVANASNVFVDVFNSVPIAHKTIAGIKLVETAVSATVTGSLYQTISFVANLHDMFTTGQVNNVRFTIEEPSLTDSRGQDTKLLLDFTVIAREVIE